MSLIVRGHSFIMQSGPISRSIQTSYRIPYRAFSANSDEEKIEQKSFDWSWKAISDNFRAFCEGISISTRTLPKIIDGNFKDGDLARIDSRSPEEIFASDGFRIKKEYREINRRKKINYQDIKFQQGHTTISQVALSTTDRPGSYLDKIAGEEGGDIDEVNSYLYQFAVDADQTIAINYDALKKSGSIGNLEQERETIIKPNFEGVFVYPEQIIRCWKIKEGDLIEIELDYLRNLAPVGNLDPARNLDLVCNGHKTNPSSKVISPELAATQDKDQGNAK